MSGKDGKGSRGHRRSPGKKGDGPSGKVEAFGKDKVSEAEESIQQHNTKLPSPASSEAVKMESTNTNHESKDSVGAAGYVVAASVKATDDNPLKDIGQDAKVKQSTEENTVDSKPVNPVTSKSEVKAEEVEKVPKTGDQGKNNTGKESELNSPEATAKSSFFSNNGSAKKRSSPDFTKQQNSSNRYGTRSAAVMQERGRFLAMTVEEKRKFYGHRNYVTLDEIEAWSKYYSHYEKQLKKLYPSNEKEILRELNDFPKIEVDEKLNAKVSLFEGDITSLEIDGIVNAANRSLLGGGGVDGAIHRAAGSQLVAECQLLNGCDTGNAKTTCGYKLPAKYVIHTVGPQMTNRTELRNCYKNCFKEMAEHNMHSIAFCCISTGIYGYPNEVAVHDALRSTREYLMKLKEGGKIDTVDRIVFCLFLRIDIDLYKSWIQVYFPTETRKESSPNNKNNSATEISSDSDSGKEEKELKVDCSASESVDSSIVDSTEKSFLEEDMEEEVNPDKDQPQNTGLIETAVQPDKKSKLDP